MKEEQKQLLEERQGWALWLVTQPMSLFPCQEKEPNLLRKFLVEKNKKVLMC